MDKMTLFQCHGTLYELDPEDEAGNSSNQLLYQPLGTEGSFIFSIVKAEDDDDSDENSPYFIVITQNEDEEMLKQSITLNMLLSYNANTASVHWNVLVKKQLVNFSFRFQAPAGDARENESSAADEMFVCVEVFNDCVNRIISCVEDATSREMWDYMGGLAVALLRNGESEDPVFNFDLEQLSVATTGEGNICYASAMIHKRVLVSKKCSDSSILLQSVPYEEKALQGVNVESIEVKDVDVSNTRCLLGQAESSFMMFGGHRGTIQEIDLERATVVQEYCPENLPIRAVTHAQQTLGGGGNIYTCLSDKRAFNIDTRINPKICVVSDPDKNLAEYNLSSKHKLTCHATSADNYLVVGDAGGTIRLYTGVPGSFRAKNEYFPKRAKTNLEVGLPVISIAVSSDGHYIVASLGKFLLFIDTKLSGEANANRDLGFTARMGDKKPKPTRLQPTPEQIESMGGPEKVNFTTVSFGHHDSNKLEEQYITACCGEYLLTWSMMAITRAKEQQSEASHSALQIGSTILGLSTLEEKSIMYLTDHTVGRVGLLSANRHTNNTWSWKSIESDN